MESEQTNQTKRSEEQLKEQGPKLLKDWLSKRTYIEKLAAIAGFRMKLFLCDLSKE